MATVRSVDFLPEIFQTDANKQFLRATLDQLIQEPNFRKTQGFIGRSVGPGVDPNDKYVIEPTATRANYQLEPGVVSLIPETSQIRDAITYPGLNDAIGFQGGNAGRPDRLYSSEYYTWDPFVDFDAFVNFSQYFWVPGGPDTVDVAATGVATTDNFTVTRANGVYTFSGVNGENPIIELVRGGNYTFQVAQNSTETVNYRVRNSGTSAYVIDFQNNPSLTLARGNTYVFNLTLDGLFPFWIKTQPTTGTGEIYTQGVSRNGAATGLVTFTVPQDAPNTLYYAAQNQAGMQGTLNIVDGTPGTGPGFWIQTTPGVSGTVTATPNISSRDVLGVTNNGEDLGTVVFNVPAKDAQSFYYNLTSIGTVDLVTDMQFAQINNQPVSQFISQYNGIDGITNLDGRTLVFTNPIEDVQDGGWYRTSFFDPLIDDASNVGVAGSYDSVPYDYTIDILPNQRYQKYQISYVNIAGIVYIQVNKVADIAPLQKFTVGYGQTYSNTQWYKDATGEFKQIPLLSAAQDTLYYQDGTDPEIFGRIKLIEQTQTNVIYVDEILGRKTYTSPNGVTFSNGLRVRFTGDVSPASYGSGSAAFGYTATEAGTNYITYNDSTDLYVGQQVVFSAPSLGGLNAGQTYYVRSIAANGLKFTVSASDGGPVVSLANGTGIGTATAISSREYYVSGVGTAIELLPAVNYVVPELYVEDADDSTISTEPNQPDYLTIDRASKDLNAWTRSNRWFHIDVINATAAYNNTTAVLDNNYRAKRPIVQFRPGMRLWNMGTEGKAPVDIIDFEATDAFSNIEGTTSYSTNGYTFVEGTRVIFAADEDTSVRNRIYIVSFVTPDTIPPLIAQPIIILTQAPDGLVLLDQSTVCISGNTTAGKTFWYDGIEWAEAQQKTSVQQAPLFNIYNPDGVSFGDGTVYQSTTFAGSKLFSYAASDTTILDPVLQFPLKYLNINNVGDIVFDNNLYVDTFLYVVDNVSITSDISSGSVREYSTRTDYQKLIGWQKAAVDQQLYQQFKFSYTGATLKLDVSALTQTSIAVPVIKIYVGSIFIDPSKYTYTTTADSTVITLLDTYALTDIIEVLVLSDQTSKVAFYQVPDNLQSNPLNSNSQEFTLGTIRTHYQSICENLQTLRGPVNGANNTRDLGNIIPYGLVILQQSSPLTLAGYFMRSTDYNVFASMQYNSREYIKFKAQMLDSVLTQNIGFETTAQVLDTAIQNVTLGKLDTQPFYWSDMIPAGITYASTTYTVSFITTNVFDTVQVYNFTSQNYLGLLVYLNGEQLIRDVDYTVATDGPRITILTPLTIGDVLLVNEYNATYGNFVPNTPTKLGLYPSWKPGLVTQVTSNGNAQFILGHDGSTTPVFGDIRDDVLIEFETRIYNNLKLDGNPVPLTIDDVLPGQFRDTGYTFEEINTIFSSDFLAYCGWNKLDYNTQNYLTNNEFTYNYSSSNNRLDNQPLLGAWRGIYRYFYDTEQPSFTPWQMLGLTKEPDWWQDRYGPAPYTSDNLVLWDDLEAGLVADPIAPYTVPKYARPGLTSVIPTDSEGKLLSPLNSVVGVTPLNNSLNSKFAKSWALGDGGPVEASWYNSSSYPFSVMHVLAVTRPAKFFALFADRDRYRYNLDYDQYLLDDRYRLDANGVEVYGNGTSKASYINWIVDYNRQTGINSTGLLTADLQNLDVRLCYRMASFSDKQYIKLFTEKSSPNSTNTALMIPDQSYDILLYKNQPFDQVRYSSVAVQKVANGYAVFGFGNQQPYFNILQSQAVGRLATYSSGGITVRIPTFYTNTVVQVPYGFVFNNETAVCDFLASYGELLSTQGLSFTNIANGYVLDWPRMINEFLYWSQQGWSTDAIINLNPLAAKLEISRPLAVVDSINTETTENLLLNQNSQEIPPRALNIVRLGNNFSIEPLNLDAISYIDMRFTNYEHMIVLNNQSVFGDLIYDPTTGARQSRLSMVAMTTADWNGSVDAPGFILNQNNVEEWTGLRTYSKGEIVKYKNVYWSALTIVQPTDKFDFNVWTQSDYTQIELGLLPNLANKADQLANSYNINAANIESDNDLLAYGLIGFKPRQYMAALNLDDVSQVNVYRQFLDTKGTLLATELFRQANLGKESADYNIYENWAVQRAVYGANANRSYFELRLDRALLSSNPSLIQVIQPQQVSEADQTIFLSDVWRQSFALTSTDILPVTTELPTDLALPTAGYVSLDDADITVFDIENSASLAANIDAIQVGTSVWVAKVNSYDWDIYRAQAVPGVIQHVCDNLDGTSRVIFSTNHGLAVGNKLIIKFFDAEINGVYQVLSVPNLTTVNIAFNFTGDRVVANGTGLGFTLQTMRVAQASDVINLPYANNILPGAKVWVDNNGQGLWEVLEKNSVFSDVISLNPVLLDAGEQYGTSVAQARNRLAALVGSPRYGFGSGTEYGAIYVYVKSYGDQYIPVSPIGTNDSILTVTTAGTRGLGNAVDFGDQTWAVAGASASQGTGSLANVGYAFVIFRDPLLGEPGTSPYTTWQLLTPPTAPDRAVAGEMGYSVAASRDERWMYIGAPGANQVHAYGRVDWQQQELKQFADGVTKSWNIIDTIQIDNIYQLKVSLNRQVQTVGVDYTIAGLNKVTFNNTPGLINATAIVPGTEYTILTVGTTDFVSIGAASNTVGVTFTATGAGTGTGTVLEETLIEFARYNSYQIPYAAATQNLADGLDSDGRRLGLSTVAPNDIYSFSIKLNSDLLRPNIDYTFAGTTVTFLRSFISADILVVSAKGYFTYVYTIDSSDITGGLTAGDRFGHSVCCTTDGRQVLIGTPYKAMANAIDTISSTGMAAAGTAAYSNLSQYSTSGSGFGAEFNVSRSGSSYTVTVVRGGQDYAVNDTVTILGTSLGGTSVNNLTITVTKVETFTETGSTYVFDRNVQKFVYGTDGSTVDFTVLGSVTGPVSVSVNGQFLINQQNSVDAGPGLFNTFTVNGNTITINSNLVIGDIIEIETNQFRQVQEVEQNIVAEFSNFGQATDICTNNCSLYVGEPQSSQQVFKGGVVERFVNQSRVYGTITSTVPMANLVSGDTIRVNDIDVVVPGAWSSSVGYDINTVVYNTSSSTTQIYVSIQNVPVATALTNTAYWTLLESTTVLASVEVRALAQQITLSVSNVLATVNAAGYLTLSVKNSDAAPEYDKLQVAPGSIGTTFASLGFETFAWTQTIESPYATEMAGFGASLSIDDSAVNLVVGAPRGTLYLETEFDDGTTFFDAGSTVFFSIIVQSGAVYTYDYLPSSTLLITNPGKFVFGQQVNNSDVAPYDGFGTVVNYTSGVLMAGAPKNDYDDSAADFGAVFVFENATRTPSWTVLREQQPVVDIRLLNSVFLYDRITSAKSEFLDFINPLQGRILGAARQNLDYIGAVDPASYNIGPANITGTTWGAGNVGQLWWDVSSVRFIDPNQDSIVYASRRWAQLFPGSEVDVYQWIVSDQPPGSYTGEGVPLNTASYTVNSKLTIDGTFATEYYFWVRGITVTATQLGKTLPASTVASYIQDPRASGIAYMAPINASTIALYNSADYIEASDTIVSIEFDRELTTDNVHVEYELIPQDRADGFLSSGLYRKFQDSFCGVDTFGNLVPDPNLSPAEQYGVQFRPRQSMFVNRLAALKNYLTRTNAVLAQYPIAETRIFNLLNSSEPEPNQTAVVDGVTVTNWNLRVANQEILGFQQPYWSNPDGPIPVGYKYLVVSDSANRGLWTIYTVQNSDVTAGQRVLVLTSVQGYNTPDYWSYITWNRPGYNPSTKVITEVANYAALASLTVDIGSSVKVTANAQGKYEIYLRTDTGWERVVLQDGTIEFSAELYDYALGRFGFDLEVFDAQYYDQEPVTETRKVIQAINEELFVDDLAIERNKALVLMFNYVLSEFSAPEWLVKTSLIDVDHRIRDLLPFQNYRQDNQEFVADYIQEVKPYHVSIREFNLKYTGNDQSFGDNTDFDLPAYFNTDLQVAKYTSPILLPYENSTAFNASINIQSDLPASSTLWETWPYSQWYTNYLLSLDSVEIIDSGSGYNEPPQVTFVGDAVVEAQGTAVINSLGQVVAITITDPGQGYRSTPTVEFSGGNGTGVRAYVHLIGSGQGQTFNTEQTGAEENYNLVRTFRTVIKYDRFQYFSDVQDWSPNGTYQDGQLVRFDNRVWQAASADSTAVIGPTFNLEDWTEVNAGTFNNGVGLTGVDRTMGLYVPGVNSPGLELPLLIDGVDYPGVQVYGDYFLGDPLAVDAEYTSEFTDATLGTLPTDINVDGGEFIGLYEGHAPEELVNGAEFDTLDMRVYTRPGADWSRDGHGFQLGTIRYEYEPAVTSTLSWAGVVEHPVQVLVSNITTGIDLVPGIDFTIDWDDYTVTLLTVTAGDIVNISVYELGGGSQLYRANYLGGNIGSTVVIPVNSAEISDVYVFVNGASVGGISWTPYIESTTWDILNSYSRLDIVNNSGTYYRAQQDVPPGIVITNLDYWISFVPTLESEVDLGTSYGLGAGIALVAFGLTTVESGYFIKGNQYTIATLGTTNFVSIGAASNTVGVTFTATGAGTGTGTATIDYSWSTPQVQYKVADAAMVAAPVITLTNSIQGSNSANMVVTRNGLRLQPPEGIEWVGNNVEVSFGLPQRGGYSQSIIDAPNDIQVWVDNVLQVQSIGVTTGSYSVSNWAGSNTPGRQVVFTSPPADGARILISVATEADYQVVAQTVQISSGVNLDDVFAVITWNDTAQQNPVTLVFNGPIITGLTIAEPYDSTVYDAATVSGDPGSYDYSVGTAVASNDFLLNRTSVNAGRLWVTLDGYRLFEGADFTVEDDGSTLESATLILAQGAIQPAQILAVTMFTDSIVPEAMAFRIFQDMRGVQATYRITAATSTTLSQDLSATADTIYVTDASALTEPNLELGVFGVITIDGERIMYRSRNTALNTISSLLRGTAGTGAAAHAVGADVYDTGRGNLLDQQYQNYTVSDTAMGDGTTSVFYAPSINVANFEDSSTENLSIEVYVGGRRQYKYSDTTATSKYRWFLSQFDPVTIEFVVDDTVYPTLQAPAEGSEVTILVRQGVTWYQQGATTASNGVALQDTDTLAARFLRGE
jgi:hypothetical protein